MPSAFISYAHEDQEFVLALVEQLKTQDLDIRYDQVVLQIGDSLIEVISQEISDGDFLIAIISPDSINSAWCQKEVALAATQGVNERRVKVLPVRFREAPMPPALQDTYWADADVDDIETLARRLAAAVTANLEGREADAARAAQEAKPGEGQPAHAERPGDVTVDAIDSVAERTWDVLAAWSDVWAGQRNIRDLEDPQRRLRWSLDVLPDWVQVGLPLAKTLANPEWKELVQSEPDEVEPDLREELRSVRTQVAQGLPVTRRWSIESDFGPVDAGSRDAVAYLWQLARGDETRRIVVFISGTAMAVDDRHLPRDVAQAKATRGRSVVSTLLPLDDPPSEVMVTTAGISHAMPE